MKKILKIFTKNKFEKVLALLVTIIIWAIVISKTEETKDFDITIKVKTGLNTVVVNDPVNTIHITAKGNSFSFARLASEEKILDVDLSLKEPGQTMIYFDQSKVPASKYLDIEKVFPKEIIYNIEKLVEKTVKIEPYINGQPSRGFKIEKVETSPSKVKIKGPESILKDLEYIPTEKINISSLNRSKIFTTKLFFNSQNIKLTDDRKITVAIALAKDIRETLLNAEIILETGLPIKTRPSYIPIKIKGNVEDIEAIKNKGLFVYVKDSEKSKYKVREYSFKNLPSSIEILKQPKITIIVEKQ